MRGKPMTAVRVSDLHRSVAFYTDRLGFELVQLVPDADLAEIDTGGYRILLAGPDARDLARHLHETHEVVRHGATVFAFAPDLDACHAAMVARGISTAHLMQRPWGDRMLRVPDPDGYTVSFWTQVERSPDESVALYARGPEELERALGGLPDADLDLSARAGHWSIRQITHHIADSEVAVLGRLTSALAEPGRVYLANPYSQDAWAEGLDYAHRPVEPAVALFWAIRLHVRELIEHLPGAWERAYRTAEGAEQRVGPLISMLGSHALEHVEDIRDIRRMHGR